MKNDNSNELNKAEEYYNSLSSKNFYSDMSMDLKAIGKTEKEIFEEFIVRAFLQGYYTALFSKKD
jgi:hypothetical protein